MPVRKDIFPVHHYLPLLTLEDEEPPTYGKYGMLRKTYLQEHKTAQYYLLLLQSRLTVHLNQIGRGACERMELLVTQMAQAQGVTEKLKAQDAMLWVGRMNNIRNAAAEVVLYELIYV